MELEPAYRDLLEGQYTTVANTLVGREDAGGKALLALALTLHRRNKEAEVLITSMDESTLASPSRGHLLEGMALLAAVQRRPYPEVRELAEEAIRANPAAVFARRLLGRLAEAERDYARALEHYQAVRGLYPSGTRSVFDQARMLFRLGRGAEARHALREAPLSLRRIAYELAFNRRGPTGIGIGLACVFLVLIPATSLPATAIIGALGAALIITSVLVSDTLMFSTGVWIELLIAAAWIMRLLFDKTMGA
jgi:tetratricopeptide (TPR) repeat protein